MILDTRTAERKKKKMNMPIELRLADFRWDFVFDAFGIDSFFSPTSPMRYWYEHARENVLRLPGDLFEFGVYRGASLLSMAILLKQLGSDKRIYGFDTFSGFPCYGPEDDLDQFRELFSTGQISKSHYLKHQLLLRLKQDTGSMEEVTTANISTSGDFSEVSYRQLMRRIKLLGLDNIKLIKGPFQDTVPKFFQGSQHEIFSANIDCDLYQGYTITLPFIWDNLCSGGYVHLDEYYSLKFPGPRRAVNEFVRMELATLVKHRTRTAEFERWYLTK